MRYGDDGGGGCDDEGAKNWGDKCEKITPNIEWSHKCVPMLKKLFKC